MAHELHYELCPETGIGCLMIDKSDGSVKIDLMPDEAADLQSLVQSGNLDGAKALLAGIDCRAEAALDGVGIDELVEEIR